MSNVDRQARRDRRSSPVKPREVAEANISRSARVGTGSVVAGVGAGGYGILSLLAALVFSWALLAPLNFGYSVWLDHGGIGEGIDRFGVKNKFKSGFSDTTRAQRIQLFAAINLSVHKGGDGLADIRYQTSSSFGEQQLLRAPEIQHLEDVAKLLQTLFWPALLIVVLWGGLSTIYLRRHRLPKLKHQLVGVGALLSLSFTVLFVVGAERVFNQLHIWVFPAGHQWFFYYQESLMSTLMMAPTLFAWIALALLLVTLIVFFGLQWLMAHWLGKHYLAGKY